MKKSNEKSSSVLNELKIIKAEIRSLKENGKFTDIRIRGLKTSLEDETALIREQNLEFKDEILGEIMAMREELTVALGQYERHEEMLENHHQRISKIEKTSIALSS